MKRLFTFVALLAFFIGAKAEWETIYELNYSTKSGFPFYVMGYVPEWFDGVMTDQGGLYEYSEMNLSEKTSDVIVKTDPGVEYYRLDKEPSDDGNVDVLHQYFIADGIPTERGGSYTVTAMVKASEPVTININMGWGWGQGEQKSTSVAIPTEWTKVEWEYSGIGGTSCNLVAQPKTAAKIEWKWVKVTSGQNETNQNEAILYFNYITKGKVAELIQNPNGYKGKIVIPETVEHEGETYTVNKIADYAFSYCEDLTSVTIPNSVKSIGQFAFANCSSLKSLIIPEGVESIGFEAFSDCTSIVNLTLPQSLKTIDYAAFARLGITTVSIPNNISYLDGTFYGCGNLTSIIVPYNVKNLHATFFDCSKLTNIKLQEGVNTIGHATFYGCSSLKEIIIPSSVRSIADQSFMNCSSLSYLIIPNSVTSIDEDAFKGCSGLTSVTIGKGVKSINRNVFSKCDNLTDVYCMPEQISNYSWGGDGLYTASDAFNESYPEYMTLHVPAASIEAYRSTAPWSQFKAIVALEDGDNPEIKKCATPEISYTSGKLDFTCDTEGVEFVSEVIVDDAKKYYDASVTLSQTYKVTVYATKAGYENSDVTTREIVIENGQTTLFGDINKDGNVNVTDVVKLLDIIMNK